jgi:hypothetical protein
LYTLSACSFLASLFLLSAFPSKFDALTHQFLLIFNVVFKLLRSRSGIYLRGWDSMVRGSIRCPRRRPRGHIVQRLVS